MRMVPAPTFLGALTDAPTAARRCCERTQMSVVTSQLPNPWSTLGPPALSVGLLLFLLLLVVLLYVFTRNYVRVRAEHFEPDAQPGEVVRDRVTTNRLFSQTESVLTTHSILQFR